MDEPELVVSPLCLCQMSPPCPLAHTNQKKAEGPHLIFEVRVEVKVKDLLGRLGFLDEQRVGKRLLSTR